jgi:hypothetical protein
MLPPAGTAGTISVLDASTGQQKFAINPYPGFTGGVSAAVGDVDGDGTTDVITAPGAGGGAMVSVFSGTDGTPLGSFLVGDAGARSGVSVAAADLDGDGRAEIIAATVHNGQSVVRVVRGTDGSSVRDLTPFVGSPGMSVAAGDFDGNGTPDVVVGAGPGDAPRVVVLDGADSHVLFSQFAFEQTFTGGVRVAAANLDSDAKVEVICAAGFLGGPRVQVYAGGTGAVFQNFFAYSEALRDGVFAAAADVNTNGVIELVTRGGSGQTGKGFDPHTLSETSLGAYSGGLPAGSAYDTTAPAVAVTSSAPVTTADSPIHFTATFTEGVNGFAAGDLQITNGTATNVTRVDGKTYNFDVIPAAPGVVTVTVAAGAVTDAAGNASTASTPVSRTFSPTVTVTNLTTKDTTPTLQGTVAAGATVTVTVGGQTVPATVTGTTWTATVPSPMLEGTYNAIASATLAGATSTGSGTLIIDTTAPTATVTSSAPEPTTTSPIPFTVTFSEDVTGFAASGVTVVNGTVTAGGFTQVDAKHYTFTVTPTSTGAVTVSVAAGVATDAAGNTNTAASGLTRTFNGSTGTITVTADPKTTNDTTPTLTGTVSDPAATVQVTAGGQQVQATVSGTNWTATIPNVMTPGTYDIQVQATSGTNTGSTTNTGGLVIDTTAPAPTVSTTANSPTNLAAIPFTVDFGETVTGFDKTDITVANGTASDPAAGPGAGRFTFTVTPTIDGTVSVSVVASAATDAAGNASTASNVVSVTSDRTDPTAPGVGGLDAASDTGNSSSDGVTSNTTPTIVGAGETGTSIEVVADNGTGAISLGKVTVVAGAWSLTPTTPLGDGTYVIRATATDAAGNTSPSSDPFNLVIDATTPTAPIDPTAGANVTGTANGTGTNVTSVLVSIFNASTNLYWNQATSTFSSPTELQFQATLTQGTGNAASWSLPYSGPNGTFDVRAVATDVAGNEIAASSSVVFTGP